MIITDKTFRFSSIKEALEFYEIIGDCHIFKGSCCPEGTLTKCSKKGYGHFQVNKKHYYAHRAAYEYYKGTIPVKMIVCHKCNEKSCINPDHLYLGTHIQNAKDRTEMLKNKPITENFKFEKFFSKELARVTICLDSEFFDSVKLHSFLCKTTMSNFIRSALIAKIKDIREKNKEILPKIDLLKEKK